MRQDRRDRWHATRAIRVLRYWNPDVLTNAEGVGADIATALSNARWEVKS